MKHKLTLEPAQPAGWKTISDNGVLLMLDATADFAVEDLTGVSQYAGKPVKITVSTSKPKGKHHKVELSYATGGACNCYTVEGFDRRVEICKAGLEEVFGEVPSTFYVTFN